jgi:hypothetical protein
MAMGFETRIRPRFYSSATSNDIKLSGERSESAAARCQTPLTGERFPDGRWPAMLMQAGQNLNAVRKHDVEQRVRKARDKRAPGAAVSQGAGERMLRDELHDKLE